MLLDHLVVYWREVLASLPDCLLHTGNRPVALLCYRFLRLHMAHLLPLCRTQYLGNLPCSEMCYVVLPCRRGPRPQDVPDISISRTFNVGPNTDASEADEQLQLGEPWQPSEAAIQAQMRRNRQKRLKHEQMLSQPEAAVARGNSMPNQFASEVADRGVEAPQESGVLDIPTDVFDSMARDSFWPERAGRHHGAVSGSPTAADRVPALHQTSDQSAAVQQQSSDPGQQHNAADVSSIASTQAFVDQPPATAAAAATVQQRPAATAGKQRLTFELVPRTVSEAFGDADIEDKHTLELLQALADALDEDLQGSGGSSSSSSSSSDSSSDSGDSDSSVGGGSTSALANSMVGMEGVAGSSELGQASADMDVRLGPFGRGLVDRLVALEDQGEWPGRLH